LDLGGRKGERDETKVRGIRGKEKKERGGGRGEPDGMTCEGNRP